MYNNREALKENREREIVAALMNPGRGAPRGRGERGRGREGMGRGVSAQLGPNQCAICRQDGHWKREWPQGRGGESGLRPEQAQIATRLLALDGDTDQ